MRKMKKVLSLVLSLVLVCGIVAGFAACSGNKENNKKEDTTAQSDLAKIQAAGVLKVGITEYEPMNYKDKNNEWTGFDTEFAQALEATADGVLILDRDWRVGPMFTLKSAMDAGQAMRVGASDYDDPLRWWL